MSKQISPMKTKAETHVIALSDGKDSTALEVKRWI